MKNEKSQLKIKNLILATLILSIILFGQAAFVLAVDPGKKCESCCPAPGCETGLECVGYGSNCDVATNKNTGQCKETGKVTFCSLTKHKDIKDLVNEITKWVAYIAIIVAPLMIVVGAFMIMTAAGEDRKVTAGKNIIKWAVIGLAIILFARAFSAIIKKILSG